VESLVAAHFGPGLHSPGSNLVIGACYNFEPCQRIRGTKKLRSESFVMACRSRRTTTGPWLLLRSGSKLFGL
jgi:hypothetical protein